MIAREKGIELKYKDVELRNKFQQPNNKDYDADILKAASVIVGRRCDQSIYRDKLKLVSGDWASFHSDTIETLCIRVRIRILLKRRQVLNRKESFELSLLLYSLKLMRHRKKRTKKCDKALVVMLSVFKTEIEDKDELIKEAKLLKIDSSNELKSLTLLHVILDYWSVILHDERITDDEINNSNIFEFIARPILMINRKLERETIDILLSKMHNDTTAVKELLTELKNIDRSQNMPQLVDANLIFGHVDVVDDQEIYNMAYNWTNMGEKTFSGYETAYMNMSHERDIQTQDTSNIQSTEFWQEVSSNLQTPGSQRQFVGKIDELTGHADKAEYWQGIEPTALYPMLKRFYGTKVESYVVPKKETGKVRLIANTNDYSHLMTTLIYTGWRIYAKALIKESPIYFDGDETLDNILQLQSLQSGEYVNLPIDQSKFDHKVTRWMVADFMNIILNRLIRHGIIEDCDRIKLINDFLDNQFLNVGQRTIKYRDGILSGWHITSICGTYVNLIQFKTISQIAHMVVGGKVIFCEFQGDDVAAVLSDLIYACEILYWYNVMGLIVNPTKTMLSITNTEFLRVIYTKEQLRGYFMRTVSGLLYSKPWNRIYQDNTAEMMNQLAMMVTRGHSNYGLLAYDILRHRGYSSAQTINYMNTQAIDGGLGFWPYHSSDISTRLVVKHSKAVINEVTVKNMTWRHKYIGLPVHVIEASETYQATEKRKNIKGVGGKVQRYLETRKAQNKSKSLMTMFQNFEDKTELAIYCEPMPGMLRYAEQQTKLNKDINTIDAKGLWRQTLRLYLSWINIICDSRKAMRSNDLVGYSRQLTTKLIQGTLGSGISMIEQQDQKRNIIYNQTLNRLFNARHTMHLGLSSLRDMMHRAAELSI